MSEELNETIDRFSHTPETDKPAVMDEVLEEFGETRLALLLEAMPIDERMLRWHSIPSEEQAAILIEMRGDARNSIIRALSPEQLERLIGQLDAQDLIEIGDSLPQSVVEDALEHMDAEQREYFERSLQYNEEQIGRYVDHNLLMLPAAARVQDADRLLRRPLPPYTDSIYLFDRSGRFQGTVSTSQLFTLPGHIHLSTQIDEDAEPLSGEAELYAAATAVQESGAMALPVVDEQNRLLGRVTLHDAMVLQQSHFENLLMARAGMNEEEDLFAPVLRSSRRRATWLGINLLTAFLASWTIGLFEATLQQVVALAVLMPVVASMGGIAGSQTLTLMIRGLALKQVSRGNLVSLLKKELGIAGVNGLIWALVIAVIASVWFSSPLIGLVIAIAIAVNIVAAAFSGVMVPMVLDHLKIDPALSGSVILTTVTDVVGFFVFLGLGALLLI
ncbi:magnesium transporter [Aestuariirhabdus litorea]|uniref:Magnesium transporter n=1 Tax=Aestuariirhabdus litorea TaxID=2528527 RepID=A0A3P3VQB5_9GAMM|nr:magnesium transporter [Aestuariirhabdus litorea]RRJ83846.1 magnesium transporter [Aestuariirhabdus litorea]RWW97069.1 magnesium transporter [Endozoicomonadaceae bacterium GTF-13]